jgi:hypothetical protein
MNNSKVRNNNLKKRNNLKNEGFVTQVEKEKIDLKKSNISNDEINTDEKKLEVTELDFEINENAEVEWEISIPNFLRTFQNNYINAKTMTIKTINTKNTKNNVENIDNKQEDDQDETSLLIKKDENKMKQDNIIKEEKKENDNNNNYLSNDQIKNFHNEITKYRNLFSSRNKAQISELIQILDKKKTSNDKTYKFIVSFNQLNYGDKKVAYIIRCIDNKEGGGSKSSSHQNQENNKNMGATTTLITLNEQRKKYFDKSNYLKDMNEVLKKSEIQIVKIKTNIEQLDILANNNDTIRNLIDNYHKEILKFSRVLGINSINVFDENGSQASSQSDYTNSITKKTRIQEIK